MLKSLPSPSLCVTVQNFKIAIRNNLHIITQAKKVNDFFKNQDRDRNPFFFNNIK